MQIAQALRQTTKPFVSLEFFPPAAESHLPEFYETVERLRSIDPLFLSVTYGAGGGKQQIERQIQHDQKQVQLVVSISAIHKSPDGVSDHKKGPL